MGHYTYKEDSDFGKMMNGGESGLLYYWERWKRRTAECGVRVPTLASVEVGAGGSCERRDASSTPNELSNLSSPSQSAHYVCVLGVQDCVHVCITYQMQAWSKCTKGALVTDLSAHVRHSVSSQ